MSKNDVQKDLDTIKAGVLAIVEASAPPKKGKEKGEKALDYAAMREKHEAVMEEHVPKMIDAGFRIVGGLFINLQRIADSAEDQGGAG